MNTDQENNPNNFSLDEPNFIPMPYPAHPPPQWIESQTPPRNYIRPVIAIMMVLLLILSVSYTTLQSIFEKSSDRPVPVTPNFDAILTGASTTTTDCQDAPRVTLGGTNPPTNRLCVCGSLYTDESTVNYLLRLRSVEGNIVAQIELSNQTEGSFCQLWQFSNTIAEGRYAIEIAPNTASQSVEVIWMTIATQPF